MSKAFEPLAAKFALPVGDAKVPVYQWNEDRTDLVKVGERDAAKEMNERAVGTTVYELIAKFGGLENVDANFPGPGDIEQDLTMFPQTSGEITEMELAYQKVIDSQASIQEDKKTSAAEEIAALKAKIAELEKSGEGETK